MRWCACPPRLSGRKPRAASTATSGHGAMGGMVWEWCNSLHKPYPYRNDDGREDRNANGACVLRGGSYLYLRADCRAAFRSWYAPDRFYGDLGFRVVIAPLAAADR